MDPELTDLVGVAGAPLVTAIVAIVRPWLPDDRWIPVITLIVAVVLNEALAAASDGQWAKAAIRGVIAGLVASGLYGQAKVMIKPGP